MVYQLKLNGRKFWITVDKHGYRDRFYATEITGSEIGCPSNDIGYFGSYMPGSKTCGFSFSENTSPTGLPFSFKADARGPKTAVKILLTEYLNNFLPEVV